MKIVYILFALVCFNLISAEESYVVTDLIVPDSVSSVATDINEQGQIVGYYTPIKNPRTKVVFLWDKEVGFLDLGIVTETDPKMNNLGHIITSKRPYQGLMAMVYKNKRRPYLWTKNGNKALGTPPVDWETFDFNKLHLAAVSINDQDQVLVKMEELEEAVWVWQDDKYQKIKEVYAAHHLSNQQIISGVAHLSGGWLKRLNLPLQYDLNQQTSTLIPFQHKISGNIFMTNELGESIGEVEGVETRQKSYFFWSSQEGFLELPKDFAPVWMNNHGEVIGTKDGKASKQLYLYDGKTLTEISAEGIDKVNKINDQRQIVGSRLVLENNKVRSQAVLIELIK